MVLGLRSSKRKLLLPDSEEVLLEMCEVALQHHCSILVQVEIPQVVRGLCFGNMGGVIFCFVGPVQWYRWTGPQCPLTTAYLSLQYLCCNSLCARELGSVCHIWYNSPVLSGVLCEFKYPPSNSSEDLLSEDLSPRPTPQDYLA